MGRITTFLIIGAFIIFGFSFLFSGKTTHAQTTTAAKITSRPFGGKIIVGPKANRVLDAESLGFVCTIPGTTFDIKPYGPFPTGPYYIPPTVIVRGGGIAEPPRWTLGLYNLTPTIFTCTHPETGDTTTVRTYPVTLIGTSKI